MQTRHDIARIVNIFGKSVCGLQMFELRGNSTAEANSRLAQWRVLWLIEHSTSHQLLWCIDSFVLQNPPLRQAPNRWR